MDEESRPSPEAGISYIFPIHSDTMEERQDIYVGMGGWDLFPFNRIFYPPSPKRGFRKLEYYSRFFDFVEINSTFYNTSFSPLQIHQWLQDVSANGKFIF